MLGYFIPFFCSRLISVEAGDIEPHVSHYKVFRDTTTVEAMRERTPRGAVKWQVSSVKMLLERAVRMGMLEVE